MIRRQSPIIPKTANFTVDIGATRSGTRFVNRGAVAGITMVLPLPQTGVLSFDGYYVELCGEADFNLTISTTAGKAIILNNAAATALGATTAGQKIGACIRATWHAAIGKWFLQGVAVGVTYS